jgi:hypothetical protein
VDRHALRSALAPLCRTQCPLQPASQASREATMTFFTLSTQVSGGGRCDLPEPRSLPRRLRTDRLPLACELLRFGDLRWGHLASDLEAGLRKRRAVRARVRALWGLSGWRGNERIADSIKKGPPGARAGGGCCSGSDRAPNFQGSAAGSGIPFEAWRSWHHYGFIACPASKLRHTCSDHCCRMGADCRELRALGLKGNCMP